MTQFNETRPARKNGFSALEALAALLILAVALGPIFSLRAQSAQAISRQQETLRNINADRNMLALISRINVMAEPNGERQVDGYAQISWRATPISDERETLAYRGERGSFIIALYRVEVTIQSPGRIDPHTLVLDQVGWRKK
jgi:Tfp pilus assembly protein PilV